MNRFFVLATLVVTVAGHGWMMTPFPRAAGPDATLASVQGSGYASGTAPCGKGTGTTVVDTFSAGQTIELGYKRANNHGNTGPTVDFTIFYMDSDAEPARADFEGANSEILVEGATMDTNTRDPQYVEVTLPIGRSGKAAIQFHWTPTSGGNWYDCAFVDILSDGINATNNACYNAPPNGGCFYDEDDAMATAMCIPKVDPAVRECKCRVGYYGDGITSCAMMPANIQCRLKILSILSNISQDMYTNALADLMNIPPGRILYDRAETTVEDEVSVVLFEIVGGPLGEDPMHDAYLLRNAVGQDDGALDDLPHEVLSVQAMGVDQRPIEIGSGAVTAPGASSGGSGGSGGTTGVSPSAGSVTSVSLVLLALAALLCA